MDMIIALLVGLLLQSPLQFEVASIKANKSGLGGGSMDFQPNGRVNIVNATFKMMMQASYRLQDYQIIGGPNWVNTDRFDVQATPSEYKPAPPAPRPAAPCFGSGCPMTPAQVMMQDLLRHRFELKTHRETRELQVFELRIGRNGFKLREVDPQKAIVASPPPPPGTPPPTNIASVPTPPPGGIGIFATALAGSSVPISALASSLSGILGRPVIDKTGIKGDYDFKLVYSPAGLIGSPGPPAAPAAGTDASEPLPSIFTAFQEQLGLQLDSAKGPVEVVVIDNVSKPMEN